MWPMGLLFAVWFLLKRDELVAKQLLGLYITRIKTSCVQTLKNETNENLTMFYLQNSK